MTQAALKQTALNASAATAELVARILTQFPQAQIHPRPLPMSDEDISLEVVLPMTMEEIYRAREWIYDVVIELQEHYDVLILASAVPQEEHTNATP